MINIRDFGKFSTKSIFHISNIQSRNNTFLSKTGGTFLGEESGSEFSDTDDDDNFNLASGMVDGIDLFDGEMKQETITIIKENDFRNSSTVDQALLKKLNDSGQTFWQKNVERFPDLDSWNEKTSYKYIDTNTPEVDNDDERENVQSHFLGNFGEDNQQ